MEKIISYNHIISLENLHDAWREFSRGKKLKKDVAFFSLNLSNTIWGLYTDLKQGRYRHGGYTAFSINDTKPRDIHKACVRDRLLHHAVYRVLYPILDRRFIFDSYSCRDGKGVHRALDRFRSFAFSASESHSRTCFVLKCDIRKFFASVGHAVLLQTIRRHISDPDIVRLLGEIINSFQSGDRKGLPLGNLTSQLLVNVYMNEFDQYVKHTLKSRYYIRYADDFVILHHDKALLEDILVHIRSFLKDRLQLLLHPNKVSIETLASGVDFLGWVHFPDHRVLRTTTRRRMFARLQAFPRENVVSSYFGLLRHGNAFALQKEISALV